MAEPTLAGSATRSRDPVFWSDVTQLVKTVLAVSSGVGLAVELVDLPQSFLAPWAALLVVHSTVYRTFSQGARQVGGGRRRRACSPGRSAT